MNQRVQYAAISFATTMLGIGALAIAYVYGTYLGPSVTSYVSFQPTTRDVRAGGLVEIQATYHKRFDCGGAATIVLDDADPVAGPRIVHSIPLGDRPPGQWSITRRLRVPDDAHAGKATIQETLSYYCGWRTQVVRSPVVTVNIIE